MKRFLIAFLSVAAIASFGASYVRVDVNGARQNTKLVFDATGPMKFQNISWGKAEARPYSFTGCNWNSIGDQWQEHKVAFKAESDGTITVSLSGQWAKTKDQMGWISVSGIRLNGDLLPNGDLKKSTTDPQGRTVAAGFICTGKSQYSAEGGPDGMGMETINHDNRLNFPLKVETGKSYTITFFAKAAKAPDAK